MWQTSQLRASRCLLRLQSQLCLWTWEKRIHVIESRTPWVHMATSGTLLQLCGPTAALHVVTCRHCCFRQTLALLPCVINISRFPSMQSTLPSRKQLHHSSRNFAVLRNSSSSLIKTSLIKACSTFERLQNKFTPALQTPNHHVGLARRKGWRQGQEQDPTRLQTRGARRCALDYLAFPQESY